MTVPTRRAVIALGAVGVAAGVAFGFAPDLVPAALRAPAESAVGAVGDSRVSIAVAAVGLIAVLWTVRSGGDTGGAGDSLVTMPPEEATTDTAVAGGGFDDAVEQVGDRSIGIGGPRGSEPAVRLRSTATTVLARTRPDDADIEAMVATGTWTDDRVAAAFLGDERTPEWTFGERLRAWLAPERETERRARRTVDALQRELDRHERRWHDGGMASSGRTDAVTDQRPEEAEVRR
ncbi:DUF7269 family protein [Halostella pelagica]|uniref:DUF7269 family protein n=1 Tax=Halostella pelagica TaxID=2583824 RepID=UPI0010819E8F|nr:hypothetical protein [Halostella pelagica]